MGFTEKVPNGKYRARWFDPAGKQSSITFELERDAKRHLRNAQADIDRGVYVDDKAGKVTFGEWAEHYMTLSEKRLARTSFARDRSYLDETQVVELAEKIHDWYEAMIYVGAYGGFRIGELCALRIDDVDWDRGHIRVDEGLTDVDGLVKFEDPKTERAYLTVPMADLALEHLRRHIDRLVDGDDPGALPFTSPEGGILRPTNWRARCFKPAVAAAKLCPLTPHDLRHTAASLFLRRRTGEQGLWAPLHDTGVARQR